MASKPDIDQLAERILRGELGRLSQAELDAVLSWISGSERLGASELIHRVGVPRERPDVMRQVYAQLDEMLFVDGRLDPRRAGLQAGVDDKLRRARYRRLMTAFHPDRHPDSAEWLTPRSQAVLDAYRDFRAGREPAAERPRPSPPPHRSRRAGRGKGPGRGWPVERSSARLTPQHAGLLTRMRIRLRSIDKLQEKILAALAVVALVPVIWVYLSYKPYRDRLAPSPTPAEIAETRTAPVPQPLPVEMLQANAGEGQPEEPVTEPAGTAETEPAADEPAVTRAEDLPPEIDLHGSSTEEREPIDLEPLLDQAAQALDQLLAFNDSEPQTPEARPEPQADPTPATPEPTREPTRNPEPRTPNPIPNETSQAVETSDATSDAPEQSREPARNPEPEIPNPIPNETSQAAETSDATSDAPEQTREPARNPEPRTPNPKEQPQAETTPEPPEPTRKPPIEKRIQSLLDNYSLQFSTGNLEGIMDLLAAEPRENHERGRAWFRENYARLFEESEARRIDIEVLDVEHRAGDWRVAARFDLRVNYAASRPVTVEQLVEYTIIENGDGRLRIRAIDY